MLVFSLAYFQILIQNIPLKKKIQIQSHILKTDKCKLNFLEELVTLVTRQFKTVSVLQQVLNFVLLYFHFCNAAEETKLKYFNESTSKNFWDVRH